MERAAVAYSKIVLEKKYPFLGPWSFAGFLFLVASFLVLFSIYRQISSDELEWTLIKSGYYPISAAPDGADLGSLILLEDDGSMTVLNPTSMCGVPTSALTEEDSIFITTSPLPFISKDPDFKKKVSESLDVSLSEINSYAGELVIDKALETATYVDFLDSKFDCVATLIENRKGECFLFYASEILVVGKPVAFTTSLSCQLFDYQNLTADQVDYLTRRRELGKHFGVSILQRISLAIDEHI